MLTFSFQDINDWCSIGILSFSSSSSKRDLLALTKDVFEPVSAAVF